MTAPLWVPSPERVADANVTAFLGELRRRRGVDLADHAELYRWSCDASAEFWSELWEFADVRGDRGATALLDGDRMPGARFFPEARLSFAENLLRGSGDGDAIVFLGEDRFRRRMSHDELRRSVAALAAELEQLGVGPGDRVAAILPNLPEAIVAALATACLGAIWSSCSPDFGVEGILDRFGQIEPKVLFCADGYLYKGREIETLARAGAVAARLPTLRTVVVAGYLDRDPDLGRLGDAAGARGPRVLLFDEAVERHPASAIDWRRFPFGHPLYVLFSSGTTGKPKCIVHGAGGTLLKHLYEHRLMCDVRPGDRVFYFTTLGWMMWNWLISGLASEATLVLYDGNPLWPHSEVLFDLAETESLTLFGTSAKFIDALRNTGARPSDGRPLAALRTITSTGSPLAPEGFEYVYEHIKRDVCLSSIAGGTDIVGCFVGGDPTGPVWAGEIQARSLGMAVEVFDDDGHPVRCAKGELVCTRPFPSMPVGFWNDADGSRYRAAYFERYPGVWWHGDFAEITEHDGVIIYGRSDATLNPGGVRIGTAEIYRQVERLPEVEEALVIGQDWKDDVRIVLFVRLREGVVLDDDLVGSIEATIRRELSPRHVPAKVLQVADIPRTKSGKITELAVRDVVHGRQVKNREALANPDALDLFAGRAELAED